MVRRFKQEISDTEATIKDACNYPVEVIMKSSDKILHEMQLRMLNKLIEIQTEQKERIKNEIAPKVNKIVSIARTMKPR